MHLKNINSLPLILLLVACVGTGKTGEWSVQELESPAGPESGEPNLSVRDGQLYMSWLEKLSDGSHALKFSVGDGESWSTPRIIATGVPFFVNWADFPSLLPFQEKGLAAHWLEKTGKSPYAY